MIDKHTLRRLADSEEKYRRLFELSEDPMWLIVQNRFEICNQAAVNILGYETSEDLKCVHPSKLSPPHQADGTDSYTKAEQMMAAAVEKGYHRFEWIHRKKSGEDFPVEVTLTAIPLDNETAIYCVWRDITKRKQAEQDILEAKAAAEAANRSKSKFLALMSHELRTPLNAILGFADFLQIDRQQPLSERQRQIVGHIHQGGTILLNLVNDLLEFAKLESDQVAITPTRFQLTEAIDTAVALAERLAAKHAVSLHWQEENSPAITISADKLRLEQALVNLLSNAVKYNRAGGNVWISSAVLPGEKTVRIHVKDDGVGIAPDQFPNIFEPFNRAGHSKSNIEGTGLGLSVTRKLAEAMGGRCDFESELAKGSTFWIDLPLGD